MKQIKTYKSPFHRRILRADNTASSDDQTDKETRKMKLVGIRLTRHVEWGIKSTIYVCYGV